MKTLIRTAGLAVGSGLAVMLLLAGPQPLDAQTSSRKHRKTPIVNDDDDAASPSPSPANRSNHGRNTKGASSPSPTPKAGAIDAPKENATPSTADEAAPAPSSKPDHSDTDHPSGGHATAPATTSSIDPGEIENFDAQAEPVRQLLTSALDLAKRNLTYTYGSADPGAGGMDCSGTIYYLLKQRGFGDVPRQANEQYSWVRRKSRFYAVLGKKQETPELDEMRPGDLLFWTGTYNVDRDPPVTHTMIYLGRRKKDGHRLMVGSSDGRPYDGQRRNGVSVFDFRLPAARSGDAADAATAAAPDHAPDFAGYGPIPGMADLSDAASRQTASEHATPASSTRDEGSQGEEPGKSAKPKTSRSSHRPRS